MIVLWLKGRSLPHRERRVRECSAGAWNLLAPQCRCIVEAAEDALHGLHTLDVRARLVIAATLAFGQSESAPGKLIAGPGTAEVDQRGQHLFLRQRYGAHSVALENERDASVQVRRGQLNRIAGNDTGIQTVEPARMPIIPRPVRDDHVIVDAIAARLGEIAIGNLVHADGARCGTVDFEGLR